MINPQNARNDNAIQITNLSIFKIVLKVYLLIPKFIFIICSKNIGLRKKALTVKKNPDHASDNEWFTYYKL